MKVKTAEATGLQLDWGLAAAETQSGTYHECGWDEADGVWVQHFGENPVRFDHTDPAVCMGLIKEHKITTAYWNITSVWSATPDDKGWDEYGDTVEQAVARCVIAMKLGDEFECPDELGVQS